MPLYLISWAIKVVPVILTGYLSLKLYQALVDAPDMVRGQMNFKRLSLTDIKIDIPRIPKKKSLIAAMEAAGKNMVFFFSFFL